MSSSPDFRDSVQRLLDVFQDALGDSFKTYYDGDPEAIPLFNLPALIVMQTQDDTTAGAAGEDDIIDRITVKVVLNKRDDFDADKVNPLNTTERRIRELIARRDPSTGNYAANTVKHVIRSLALDGITAADTAMNIQYGINPRPGGEGFADLTAEGHVSFGIEYSVVTY